MARVTRVKPFPTNYAGDAIIGTLFFTVLPDGGVDVTFHELTIHGNLRRIGHRYTIAKTWGEALAMFAARDTVRVIVRSAR